MQNRQRKEIFHLILIKPSHYDDDGYVIQWMWTAIPSNTLAVLNGIALDCVERQVLGEGVKFTISVFDESNKRVRPDKITKQIARIGGKSLVAMVGVQSNQFPRTMDLARQFRKKGMQVCIGGFHVSGSLSMLPETASDLQEAMDLGISLFAGEAENRFEDILRDAYRQEMKPLYSHLDDLPGLQGSPIPILSATQIKRTGGATTSFDAGRGCPFECSFCTIINVQGRKSRQRSAEDVEQIVRTNVAQGIYSFFITDDNFARNQQWEPILDTLIHLREEEKIQLHLTIQVDTLCHKLNRFIDKCRRAGVGRVFIGLESVNPDALASAKKRQNQISEYRRMLQEWQKADIMTCAGYILGFPSDTPESVVHDIKMIQRELPIDLLEFFILTPLPGSEDHKILHKNGVWMDPDMNKYDTCHVTTGHPLMSAEEWKGIYDLAWSTYYTPEHIETVMRRTRGKNMTRKGRALLWFYGCMTFEKVHPLDGGYYRLKYRCDRRPGHPVENPVIFYPCWIWKFLYTRFRLFGLSLRLRRINRKILNESNYLDYTDEATIPVKPEVLLDVIS